MSAPFALAMPGAPDILTLEDALLTPTRTDREARRFTGCVHDRHGRVVRMTQRDTGRDFAAVDPSVVPIPGRADRLRGRSVYLGQLPNHYGHFLLEGLARVWALAQLPPPDAYVYHRFVDMQPPRFPPFMQAGLAAFGIPRRQLRVIDAPTRCDALHVPTPRFRVTHSVAPDHIETYRRLRDFCLARAPARPAAGSGRYYFSRRGVPVASRGVANEAEVEQLFASFGFAVVEPQLLPFEAQVGLCAGATALAGFTGSALHNILFCRPGTQLIDLGDPRALPEQNLNQRCCDWIAQARAVYVPFVGVRSTGPGAPAQGSVDVDALRPRLAGLLGAA